MFFRSAASSSTVDARKVLTHLTGQKEVVAFILTSSHIQRWNVSSPADQVTIAIGETI